MNKKTKNIQVKPSNKKNENKVIIDLSDELTIYTIESIKDVIINNVKKYENIEINASNIKNMDLTFLQLIYSIQCTCKDKGKTLILNVNINDENKILLNNTDTSRILKNIEIS
jgi:anti-anti-sigma regulatory factor